MSTSTLRKRLPLIAAALSAVAVAAVAQTTPLSTGKSGSKVPNLMSGLSSALFGHETDAAPGLPNRKGPYFWETGKWTSAYGRYVQSVAVRAAASAPTTGPTWTNLGPTHADFLNNGVTLNVTDSGRLTSIVVSPDAKTIYVSAASGGLWKTSDGGQSWAPIGDSLASLSVGTLELDPNDASTLYVGLGDAFDATGVGLLKSTDGGNTWVSNTPVRLGDSTIINDIAIDRDNSNIVMAATNAGLFRSDDAGATFHAVSLSTGGDPQPFVWSVVNTAPGKFVASMEAKFSNLTGTTDGQIWHSENAGQSWTKSTGFAAAAPLGRTTLAGSPTDPTVMYAMSAISNYFAPDDLAGLFRSTDGGASWVALPTAKAQYTNHNAESPTVVTLLNGQGYYNQMIIVDPQNPRTVYIGGALLTAKVTGALGSPKFTQMSNWLAQFGLPYVHADAHTAAFTPDGTAFFVGSDGGIFKSGDKGATWTDTLNNGLTTHQVYNIGSSAAAPSEVLGGLQDNGTRLRSADTSIFNEVIGGDGFGVNINRNDGRKMLGSIYYDEILKSVDGGKTWANSWNGIREARNAKTAPFNTQIIEWLGDRTGNTLFTFTNTRIYKSTDYADHWASLGTAGLPADLLIRNIGVSDTDARVIGIAATGGRFFVTHDGGASWRQAASPPGNQRSMQSVAFDPTNSNVVYLTSVAPVASASHVWKSLDGGLTFTAIDTVSSGLPVGIPVNVVKVDPLHHSTVYAGTHLGLYRSDDGGGTWAPYGQGLPLVSVTDIYISPTGNLMRLATYGRGFWELG